jgi:hypothetical protein
MYTAFWVISHLAFSKQQSTQCTQDLSVSGHTGQAKLGMYCPSLWSQFVSALGSVQAHVRVYASGDIHSSDEY